MNAKKNTLNWLQSVSWGAVLRGFVIVFGGLGIGIGAVQSQATTSTEPTQPIELTCSQDFQLHKSLDSSRYYYYEQRLEAVENAVKAINDNTKETNEILRRQFGN